MKKSVKAYSASPIESCAHRRSRTAMADLSEDKELSFVILASVEEREAVSRLPRRGLGSFYEARYHPSVL